MNDDKRTWEMDVVLFWLDAEVPLLPCTDLLSSSYLSSSFTNCLPLLYDQSFPHASFS
jgi:hypothetical protein